MMARAKQRNCLSVSSYRIAPVERPRHILSRHQKILSVSSYRIAPVELHDRGQRRRAVQSFSILISDRSGGTNAARRQSRRYRFFQYPHIGSLRWNCERPDGPAFGPRSFSILISDRSGGTCMTASWQWQRSCSFSILISDRSGGTRLRVHGGGEMRSSFSILISDRSGGTNQLIPDSLTLLLFQYPHIGSLRWNLAPLLFSNQLLDLSVSSYRIAPVEHGRTVVRTTCLHPFSILISDRSGGTSHPVGRLQWGYIFQYPHIGSLRWNFLSRERRALMSAIFQYPHIGSLRWNATSTAAAYNERDAFSILISDRSGGTVQDDPDASAVCQLSVSSYRIAPVEQMRAAHFGMWIDLSVSSYRIAPVEPLSAVTSSTFTVGFQYPHIGSLRWNRSISSGCMLDSSLSVSSYRIAPVEPYPILPVFARQGLSVSSYRIAPVEPDRHRDRSIRSHLFQYPHIGSLRWNTCRSRRRRSGPTALSVSSYRIAPVELEADDLPDTTVEAFQYPHIGSLRWNTMRDLLCSDQPLPFSILISDRSGGTARRGASCLALSVFQYPHIGSLRWNSWRSSASWTS